MISHLHHDHLHVPSLRLLSADVRVIAPHGTARALRRTAGDLAARGEEVVPGDVVEAGGVRVRAVPAHHGGRRSPVSRHRAPHSASSWPPTTSGPGSPATPVVRRDGGAGPVGLHRLHPPSFARRFAAPGPEFVTALARACPDTRAHVPRPGGTVVLAGP